jgi:hypothetical protein
MSLPGDFPGLNTPEVQPQPQLQLNTIRRAYYYLLFGYEFYDNGTGARRRRGEDRGMGGGLRVPLALLGAFRLRIYLPDNIQASLKTSGDIMQRV